MMYHVLMGKDDQFKRYTASGAGGQRNDKRWVVLDRLDRQGGKGMRRISWHRTYAEAQAEAHRLNREQS